MSINLYNMIEFSVVIKWCKRSHQRKTLIKLPLQNQFVWDLPPPCLQWKCQKGYVYIYIHVNIIYIYICMYVCISFIYVYYKYVYMYICIYVYMYIGIYVYYIYARIRRIHICILYINIPSYTFSKKPIYIIIHIM